MHPRLQVLIEDAASRDDSSLIDFPLVPAAFAHELPSRATLVIEYFSEGLGPNAASDHYFYLGSTPSGGFVLSAESFFHLYVCESCKLSRDEMVTIENRLSSLTFSAGENRFVIDGERGFLRIAHPFLYDLTLRWNNSPPDSPSSVFDLISEIEARLINHPDKKSCHARSTEPVDLQEK